MMPIHCLSVALFCSLKTNIQRILWTFCSCFNASEAGWSPLAACANYDSDIVSLRECEHACVQLCCSPRGPLIRFWFFHLSCSPLEQKLRDFPEGSLWDMDHSHILPATCEIPCYLRCLSGLELLVLAWQRVTVSLNCVLTKKRCKGTQKRWHKYFVLLQLFWMSCAAVVSIWGKFIKDCRWYVFVKNTVLIVDMSTEESKWCREKHSCRLI